MDKRIVDFIQTIKLEVVISILVLAIFFFNFQKADLKTLLSLLLITIWGIILWFYLNQKVTDKKKDNSLTEVIIDNDHKDMSTIPEMNSDIYSVKSVPNKGWIYLKENKTLMDIVQNIIFVRTFDKEKYKSLLVYMDQYQKVYMYILAERYPCQSYIGSFLDLREKILEIMYQFYVVVPGQFKHIYGVDPYKTIEENIELFIKLSRTMLEVLENFCKLDLKEYYFPNTIPMPNDASRKIEKQNMIP